MPSIRVETVKGELLEINNVVSLSQVRELLANTYHVPIPAIRLFYCGREITDANVRLRDIEKKGNAFVVKSPTHESDILSALKLRITKFAEAHRVLCTNYNRFHKKLVRRDAQEGQMIAHILEEKEKKEAMKKEFAKRRKYLQAQQMKTAIGLLDKQLEKMRKSRTEPGHHDTTLAASAEQIMQTYKIIRSDVITKLSQTKQVLMIYYTKLTSEDLTALDRLQARLDVLAADNDTKLKAAMKRFAKDVMDTEQKMHVLAEKEEYQAANDAKTHLVWLHKQIKVLSKFKLGATLVEYKKLYNTKSQHKNIASPAGVSLNVHGEFEIFLTYEAVSRVLRQRVARLKNHAKNTQVTLLKLAELVQLVASPDHEMASSQRNQNIVKKILSTVMSLTNSKASDRSTPVKRAKARTPGKGGPPPHPPMSAAASARAAAGSPGASSWAPDNSSYRNNGGAARTNTERALHEMEMNTATPKIPLAPTPAAQIRKPKTPVTAQTKDSIANLEMEIHDLIGFFSPARSVTA